MKFTLVSTIYNEARRLSESLDDLSKQTVYPDEIIIVDAGSNDGSVDILKQWALTMPCKVDVIVEPKCNVARGRNIAIEKASNELIVSTDFGCRFHANWLASLVEPFSDSKVKAVAGAFAVIEDDIVTMPAKSAYLLFDGYEDDITQDWFTPSSRSVAYYKEVFQLVGGYPEWLTLAADDTVFGRLVKKKGVTFYPVTKPYVYWGRHSTALAYAKESFRYGLGDGEARINERSTVAKSIELLLRINFILGGLLSLILIFSLDVSPYIGLLLLPALRGFKPYWYHFLVWKKRKSSKYNMMVFLYSFYLLEKTRWYYLKGYKQGRFNSPEYRNVKAKELTEIL
ncbi:MAG: glycosyltransferase [Cytophagaceae bacterium]